MARRRKNIQEETAVEPVVAPEPEVAAEVAVSADTGDTSRPQDKDQGDDMSRADKISAIVVNVMSADDAAVNKVLAATAEAKPEEGEGKPEQTNDAVGDVAPGNQASLDMKPSQASPAQVEMKEAIEVLFAGEELSESFKNKTAALFEAIVAERVEKIEADLTEELAEDFETQLANEKQFMEEALDAYLTTAAQNYMTENAIALENGIKSDLYENMIVDISNVIKSYNIAIDDSQVELVSEAYAEVDAITSKANELTEAVQQRDQYISGLERQLVFEAVASDLTAIQRSSFATLAESVEPDSVDVMTDKFVALKEHLLSKEPTTVSEEAFEVSEEILTEETETPKYTHENMSAYVNAVSSQVRKL